MPLDIDILIYGLHMHGTEACRGWLPCLSCLCLWSLVSVSANSHPLNFHLQAPFASLAWPRILRASKRGCKFRPFIFAVRDGDAAPLIALLSALRSPLIEALSPLWQQAGPCLPREALPTGRRKVQVVTRGHCARQAA